MAVDPDERAVHEARLVGLSAEIAALEGRLAAKRAERDAALRAAVDAGIRIDDAGPLCGLTSASAKFVLYGKAKRERKRNQS